MALLNPGLSTATRLTHIGRFFVLQIDQSPHFDRLGTDLSPGAKYFRLPDIKPGTLVPASKTNDNDGSLHIRLTITTSLLFAKTIDLTREVEGRGGLKMQCRVRKHALPLWAEGELHSRPRAAMSRRHGEVLPSSQEPDWCRASMYVGPSSVFLGRFLGCFGTPKSLVLALVPYPSTSMYVQLYPALCMQPVVSRPASFIVPFSMVPAQWYDLLFYLPPRYVVPMASAVIIVGEHRRCRTMGARPLTIRRWLRLNPSVDSVIRSVRPSHLTKILTTFTYPPPPG